MDPLSGTAVTATEHEVEDLDVMEVSLVGSPASRRKFLLYKNELGGPPDDDPDAEAEAKLAKAVAERDAAVAELAKLKKSDLPEETRKALRGALKLLAPAKDGLGDLWPVLEKAAGEEIQKAEGGAEELFKSLFPDRARAFDELEKSRDKLAGEVLALAHERALGEARKAVEGWYGAVEDNAKRLLDTREKLGAEAAEALVKRETAIADQLSKSELLKQYGTPRGGGDGSAEQALLTKAREKVATATYKGDLGQALSEARRENPELAAQYDTEAAARNGR